MARAGRDRASGDVPTERHGPLFGFAVVAVGLLSYFLPAGTAWQRRHHNTTAIVWLNILPGVVAHRLDRCPRLVPDGYTRSCGASRTARRSRTDRSAAHTQAMSLSFTVRAAIFDPPQHGLHRTMRFGCMPGVRLGR
jgi:hypothetical protein